MQYNANAAAGNGPNSEIELRGTKGTMYIRNTSWDVVPEKVSDGFIGYDHGNCANYFYLRRNVPLYAAAEPDLDAMRPPARDPTKRLNYLICWADYRDRYAMFGPVEIATCNQFTLYRLESPARLPER